jgi:CHAD domain-containing protein
MSMDVARTLVDKARELATPTPDPQPDRAYRLRADEHVPDAIRRIARGQLHDARDELQAAPSRRAGRAVHATRKRFKRLRACVRLARDAIGEQTYEEENTTLRMAAQRISAPRDAQVLVETLDGLTERFAEELPERATAMLRDRLEADRKTATASLEQADGAITATLVTIDDVLARTPAWTFEQDGFDALSPGLDRIYRRGRKAMRAAREDPSPEHLHEWRKRVKDLWHATQIVRSAQPKRLKRVSRRAHDLADLLGDHHDLHVLRRYATSHPQCFDDATSKRALLAVIDRRSTRLSEKALARGRKLYDRKPKRFVREIERGWRERAKGPRKSTAG